MGFTLGPLGALALFVVSLAVAGGAVTWWVLSSQARVTRARRRPEPDDAIPRAFESEPAPAGTGLVDPAEIWGPHPTPVARPRAPSPPPGAPVLPTPRRPPLPRAEPAAPREPDPGS
jgi:hypothetical protein